MRVLYVWDAEYPWDVRTEKICLALVRNGHEVVITARNRSGAPDTEPLPEGTVERLGAGPRGVRAWLSFPAFFNPFWLRHVGGIIRKQSIDLIIVRDLPLAPTALLASRGRLPVLLDMAENYPAMIKDVWIDRRQRPLDVLIRNPTIVGYIERAVISRVDHIFTVVHESSERLIALGVPSERISVVSNTPPLGRASSTSPHRPEGAIRLIYLGLMEQHRGVECVLHACAILKQVGATFHLHLVGDGRDFDDIKRCAAELCLSSAEVTFHGRLSHDAAIGLVATSHIGLVPHAARESWNTTISNKLFDYMAAGLAVISSDAVPSARVVRETGAGLVFKSGDSTDLAEAIQRCSQPTTWAQYSRAGQGAVRDKYNWEEDAQVLLDVLKQIGTRVGARGD